MNDFKSTNTSKGFTGVRVFNEKPTTVFKGTSTTESFLYMTLTEAKGKQKIADFIVSSSHCSLYYMYMHIRISAVRVHVLLPPKRFCLLCSSIM